MLAHLVVAVGDSLLAPGNFLSRIQTVVRDLVVRLASSSYPVLGLWVQVLSHRTESMPPRVEQHPAAVRGQMSKKMKDVLSQ
jgi:hypothetical protein